MSGGGGLPTLVEVLISSGVLSGSGAFIKWFFTGRGRTRIDNASLVQKMAINAIEPITKLQDQVDILRGKVSDLSLELDSVLGWALIVHVLLDQNEIAYPPIPKPLVERLQT